MHRKAALILKEIAETGHFQWKRVQRNPIGEMDNSELEIIRRKYLAYLKENNYSERTIRQRDYVFSRSVEFAGICTSIDLFTLSVSGVGDMSERVCKML